MAVQGGYPLHRHFLLPAHSWFRPFLSSGSYLVPVQSCFRPILSIGRFWLSVEFGYLPILAAGPWPLSCANAGQAKVFQPQARLRQAPKPKTPESRSPLHLSECPLRLAHPPNRQRIRTFSCRFAFRFTPLHAPRSCPTAPASRMDHCQESGHNFYPAWSCS